MATVLRTKKTESQTQCSGSKWSGGVGPLRMGATAWDKQANGHTMAKEGCWV